MQDTKLVHMANEISTYFAAYPVAEASAGIADHIRLFWTPKMRAAFVARITAHPEGVAPLVLAAFGQSAGSAPAHQ